MMQFQLRVLQDGQPPYQFEIDAESVLEARKLAESQGLTVLNVQPPSTFSLKKFSANKAISADFILPRIPCAV